MASNAQTVYEDLQRIGLPAGAAAGVTANLYAESNGVDPSAVGDSGLAHGIAQWHPDRWNAFLQWARAQGINSGLLAAQEGYVVQEMRDSGLWSRLQKINDPVQAAAIVQLEYERPASKDTTARSALAQKILAAKGAIGGADTSKAGGGTVSIPNPVTAVTDAAGGAATAAVNAARPIVLEALVALLGLGLLAAGVIQTSKGGAR